MAKIKPPKPPIKIFGVDYQHMPIPTLPGAESAFETDFQRNSRIIKTIDITYGLCFDRVFRLFNRQIGIQADIELVKEICDIGPPSIISEGLLNFISNCESSEANKEKVRTYFLKSAKKWVENVAASSAEMRKVSESVQVYGVVPEKVELNQYYSDYVTQLYSNDAHIFSQIYKCSCGRYVTPEIDTCLSCKAVLTWGKIFPNMKEIQEKRKSSIGIWDTYSQKFKTKNYGDWPDVVGTKTCTKCTNGTIIVEGEDGEEYTDHCDCRRQSQASDFFTEKLIQAGIPKDFWFLTTDGYKNPSSFSYDKVMNEVNLLIVKKYIDGIDKHIAEGRGLYLFGDNNTGKTMAMCIILKEAIKKGYSVAFQTMSEIINGYIQSWFEKKDISHFKECDLLGVDDSFDRRKTYTSETKMQISQIDDLFRYRTHHWKPILITANVAIDDVSNQDSILNLNLVRLLNRKLLQLVFRGDYSLDLQDRVKAEIIGDIFG